MADRRNENLSEPHELLRLSICIWAPSLICFRVSLTTLFVARLKRACSAKDYALPARQGDFSSVLKHEHYPPVLEMQTFNVAQINNVAPARTKENRSVELAFAVAQRPPNSKFTIGRMNKRHVLKCLEQRDVLDLPNPHFDIVGHENKIAATKCDTPRLPGVGKRPLGLYLNFCHEVALAFGI